MSFAGFEANGAQTYVAQEIYGRPLNEAETTQLRELLIRYAANQAAEVANFAIGQVINIIRRDTITIEPTPPITHKPPKKSPKKGPGPAPLSVA